MALKRGLARLTSAVAKGEEINGRFAFDLYQTEGFPLDLTIEILKQNGMKFTAEEKNAFESEFEKHKDLSRTSSAGMFKGGLAEAVEKLQPNFIQQHIFFMRHFGRFWVNMLVKKEAI